MILATGAGLSQVISITASPILTRLFSPENFGTLALFLSSSAILSILSTARYEMAIVQAKNNINAISLAFIAILISAIFLFLVQAAYIFFLNNAWAIDFNSKLDGLLVYIPIYVLIINIHKSVANYMNRNKLYKIIAFNQVVKAALQSGGKIIFGIANVLISGLVFGMLIGWFISTTMLVHRFVNNNIKQSVYIAAVKRMRINLYKYRDFPKFLLLSDGINVVAAQMPFFITGLIFSTEQLGFLFLAYSISSVPMGLIGVSISQVFRQIAVHDYNSTGKCNELFLRTFKQILSRLIPVFVLMYFLAPYLFSFVYGEQWIESGRIVQILIFMFFFQFLARILSYMYILTGHQKENIIVQVFLLVGVILSFIVGYSISSNFHTSLTLFGISYSLIYMVVIYKSYIYSQGK
jgi:O-antigen/teichoic acid export membrane protein